MHHLARTTVVTLAAAGMLAAGAAGIASGAPSERALSNEASADGTFVRGQAALDRVSARLPEIAAKYGLNPGELRRMLLEDPTLAVDRSQRLAYFDVSEPSGMAAQAPTAGTAAAAETDPFQLASLPGADKTIYLDFDGHTTTGTTWNSSSGITSIVHPPYDRDGTASSFSAGELQTIRDSWAVVAEDFAPWNINVTTIDPGTEALRRFGSGDVKWGVRVVITADTWENCGCGGFAYLGAFDDTADEPAFVFNTSFAGVSEAITHEVGHTLLLNHDGTSGSSYYTGHDTAGTPGWAPIMGASYYQPVTQWSKQEYYGANNTSEDDTAIIGSLTNGNNFGLKADDHGNTPGSATQLTTQQVSIGGIIETRADVDVFAFTTNGGDVSFIADNAVTGPNLDIRLTLRDSGGAIVAQDNVADGLDAGFDAQVPAGTFTVEVEGVGVGNPGANPPSGYTDYGSLGRYTLLGYIGGLGAPDTEAPAAPGNLVATELDGDVQLAWDVNAETDLASYAVKRSTSQSGPFVTISTVGAPTSSFVDTTTTPGWYFYAVTATDTSGNESATSNIAVVDVPEPPVDLTRHAAGETAVAGTVSGTYAATAARGGASQAITEVDSGGKPNKRYDLAEHRWTIPASEGNQTLTVVASASNGSDADSGFAIEVSSDGSTWVPFANVASGAAIDVTQSIGSPTGAVWVRAIDTDRSQGQRSHNTITVDFLEIVGDGDVVTPPMATAVVASIGTSFQGAGKGQQYGVVTVQVNDNLGAPIAGAAVTVTVSGTFTGTLSGTTNASGTVTMQTSNSERKPSFTACVASITGTALPYAAGTEGC